MPINNSETTVLDFRADTKKAEASVARLTSELKELETAQNKYNKFLSEGHPILTKTAAEIKAVQKEIAVHNSSLKTLTTTLGLAEHEARRFGIAIGEASIQHNNSAKSIKGVTNALTAYTSVTKTLNATNEMYLKGKRQVYAAMSMEMSSTEDLARARREYVRTQALEVRGTKQLVLTTSTLGNEYNFLDATIEKLNGSMNGHLATQDRLILKEKAIASSLKGAILRRGALKKVITEQLLKYDALISKSGALSTAEKQEAALAHKATLTKLRKVAATNKEFETARQLTNQINLLNAEISKQTALLNTNTTATTKNTGSKKASSTARGTGTANGKEGFTETMFGSGGTSFGHKVATTAQYAAAGSALYGLATAFRATGAAMLEFDKSTRVISAVLNVTVEESKRLGIQLETLATQFGGSIAEINQAAIALGRAGMATSDLITGTEVVIKMAMLTGDTIADATSAISSYRQVFHDSGTTVLEFGHQLAYAANKSRLSTQDIGTLSNYALAAAKSIGLTSEQVLGLSTAFSNFGLNASTIGTQIRKLAETIKTETVATEQFYSILGINQKQLLTDMQRDSYSATKIFIGQIVAMSDAQYNTAVQKLPLLQKNVFDTLRKTGSKALEHMDALYDSSNNKALDAADTIALSYSSALERIQNTFLKLTTEVGNNVLDSMFDLSNTEKFNESLETFSEILETVGRAVGIATVAFLAHSAVVKVNTVAQLAYEAALIASAKGTVLHTGATAAFSGALVIANRVLKIFLANPVILTLTAISAAWFYVAESQDAYTDSLNKASKATREFNKLKRETALTEAKQKEAEWDRSDIGKAYSLYKATSKFKQRQLAKQIRQIEYYKDQQEATSKDASLSFDVRTKAYKTFIALEEKLVALRTTQKDVKKADVASLLFVGDDDIKRMSGMVASVREMKRIGVDAGAQVAKISGLYDSVIDKVATSINNITSSTRLYSDELGNTKQPLVALSNLMIDYENSKTRFALAQAKNAKFQSSKEGQALQDEINLIDQLIRFMTKLNQLKKDKSGLTDSAKNSTNELDRMKRIEASLRIQEAILAGHPKTRLELLRITEEEQEIAAIGIARNTTDIDDKKKLLDLAKTRVAILQEEQKLLGETAKRIQEIADAGSRAVVATADSNKDSFIDPSEYQDGMIALNEEYARAYSNLDRLALGTEKFDAEVLKLQNTLEQHQILLGESFSSNLNLVPDMTGFSDMSNNIASVFNSYAGIVNKVKELEALETRRSVIEEQLSVKKQARILAETDLTLRADVSAAESATALFNLKMEQAAILSQQTSEYAAIAASEADKSISKADADAARSASHTEALKKSAKAELDYGKIKDNIAKKDREAQKKYDKALAGELKAVTVLGDLEHLIAQAKAVSTENQLQGYSDIAGAVKQMAGENEAAANVALVAQTALAVASGINAILTQGMGDPYTAFARMAAMAAMVGATLATLGESSGFAGTTAPEPESYEGTVLGSSDPSESLSNSLGTLEDYAEPQYKVLVGMHDNLQSIDQTIGGFTALLFKQLDISGLNYDDVITENLQSQTDKLGSFATDSANLILGVETTYDSIKSLTGDNEYVEALYDFSSGLTSILSGEKLSSKLAGYVFGETSQSVTDYGIQFDVQSLGQAIVDVTASTFQDVATKTKSAFHSKTKNNTYTDEIIGEADEQLTEVFAGIYDSILTAGEFLDIGTRQTFGGKLLSLAERLNAYELDIGEVSFEGLEDDEIQDALSEMFSGTADNIVEAMFGDTIKAYQKTGEGLAETLNRVALDVAVVGTNLDLTNQAITGDVIAITENLVDLSGGLENFAEESQAYYDSYFNEGEKLTDTNNLLASYFKDLNIAMPETEEGFRDIVEALDLSTASGQEAYTSLMSISDAFSAVSEYATLIQDNNTSIYGMLDAINETNLAEEYRMSLALEALGLTYAEIDSKAELSALLKEQLRSEDFLKLSKEDQIAALNKEQKAAYDTAQATIEATNNSIRAEHAKAVAMIDGSNVVVKSMNAVGASMANMSGVAFTAAATVQQTYADSILDGLLEDADPEDFYKISSAQQLDYWDTITSYEASKYAEQIANAEEAADAANDADKALKTSYEAQRDALKDFLKDVEASMKILETAIKPIEDAVNKLRGEAIGEEWNLAQYFESMDESLASAQAFAVSNDAALYDNLADDVDSTLNKISILGDETKLYEAFSDSLASTLKKISILDNTDLFSSTMEQQYEKLLAAVQLESIENTTMTEIDYLKLIEENTRAQIDKLVLLIEALSTQISNVSAPSTTTTVVYNYPAAPEPDNSDKVKVASGYMTVEEVAAAMPYRVTWKNGMLSRGIRMPSSALESVEAMQAYYDDMKSRTLNLGFAVGTSNVTQDMPANIHKGEIIVPKTFSEGLRGGDLTMGSQDKVVKELKLLRNEFVDLKALQVKQTADTKRILDTSRATLDETITIAEAV